MQNILVFGAGKSATCLIDYLIRESLTGGWRLTVADSNLSAALEKTAGHAHVRAAGIRIEEELERKSLIQEADLVISLLPAAFHQLVATDCLALGKHLLTASYIDAPMQSLADEVRQKGLLFLCEMGLDPGIDHMSAMEMIHRVRRSGATPLAFKSHTGGLISPRSDNNPWHYKISWNPRNIVRAGAAGAIYRENGRTVHKEYEELFEQCGELSVQGVGRLAYYPNRDSLHYLAIYDLNQVHTFMRTTLRYPPFCTGWKSIVAAGLTDERVPLATHGLTYKKWSSRIQPFLSPANQSQLEFLGLLDDLPVPPQAKTSADILQYLLETRLVMEPGDQDLIVMVHELAYTLKDREHLLRSSLIVEGADSRQTAMAKTVGLPLGIAAKLILERKIRLTGLHIPILPEIYEPVLAELSKQGIRFTETFN